MQFNEQSLANYKDANEEMISQLHEQVNTVKTFSSPHIQLTESITNSKQTQQAEKQTILSTLTELKNSIQSFVEDSLASLYKSFSSMYTVLAHSYVDEVPQAIRALKQPLFDNQVDEEVRLTVSAGSAEEYSINMNVREISFDHSQRGGVAKWLFSCNGSGVNFSVFFTYSETNETVCVEEGVPGKGDGRFDSYALDGTVIVEESLRVKSQVYFL